MSSIRRKRSARSTASAVSSSRDQAFSRDASDEDNNELANEPVPPRLTKRTKTDDDLDHALPAPQEAYDFKINPPPKGRSVRIYCDGIYDLFHFGHAKALEQAKKAFDDVYLLVGVCSDAETHRRKGKTVMKDLERYEAVRHCKWVDEVVKDAPWTVTQEFLDEHRIDYVAHDAEPYQSKESGDVYAFVKAQGRFLPTKRTEGISTSDLITRIVRDYDSYLRRNLERGVSAKDLNISFFKEQEIKTKKSLQQLRATVNETMIFWEGRRNEFIKGFTGVFSADGVVDKFFLKRRRHLLPGESASASASSSREPSEDELTSKSETDLETESDVHP
ncbi:hypothetical protein INT43_004746 [Umbelopsis isabellina]|uniref:choline-phosphate cytidylyltransferase n=1 Tax=Mortierella isabellina TaxID=91625 RepID=A0A8H7U7V1_MORIS|nr:hypothetical protein INT43_004746 [Umbelopsis isabellina]